MAEVGRIVKQDGQRVFFLNPGATLKGGADQYRVEGRLGMGGCAATYAVRRVSDGFPAVLKMAFTTEPRFLREDGERIRREALVMRHCGARHPNYMTRVLDEGRIRNRPFFVREGLDKLAWSRNEPGLPDDELRRKVFFMLLIDCVKAIHESGFIHCDIKPANIMQRPSDRRPLLIDFGSAHPIISDGRTPVPDWKDLTGTFGSRIFTPGYDADADTYTIQKDIFAIGQVIRDSFDQDVDPGWIEIINNCISRKREFRYDNLDRLREDIENVDRLRDKRYWQLRKRKIAEQRKIERSLSHARMRRVKWEEILQLDEQFLQKKMTVFRVVFPSYERLHYLVDEPLPLKKHSILIISGKGILDADISGPSSSVVVLRHYATLHNISTALPPENDLTYVIVGPGSYLNFPELKEVPYKAFFPGRRRILRDIDATTSFRLGGPHTFSGVEEETLDAIDTSDMPPRYKRVLKAFFKGEGFSVEPD